MIHRLVGSRLAPALHPFYFGSILVLGLLTSALCAQAQLLVNGGFDQPTVGLSPPNFPTSISGSGSGGSASANGWSLYNNSSATTSSELLSTTDPLATGYMIHINSTGGFDGIYQNFPEQISTTASVDVYVLQGTVRLYLFHSGTINLGQVDSTTTGAWQTLTLPLTSGGPNEFVLYTVGSGEFYADRAMVPVPEPSTVGLLVLGSLSMLLRRQRNT